MHFTLRTTSFVVLTFSVIALTSISCEDENNDSVDKSSVNFEQQTLSLLESDDSKTVGITLTKPVSENGQVTLRLSSSTAGVFSTLPQSVDGTITLAVDKGTTHVSFVIIPVDNTVKNGNADFVLTVQSVSRSLAIGTQNALAIKVIDDEDEHGHLQKSDASFASINGTLEENNATGDEYVINLSAPLKEAGELDITLSSQKALYQTHFLTEPAMAEGKIVLHGEPGAEKLSVKIIPINNFIITGEFDLQLNIDDTRGAIQKGTNLAMLLNITDDELANRPKGYELVVSSDRAKKTYFYNEAGRIATVQWKTETPNVRQGTDTYFYDEAGRISKINPYPGKDIVYVWEQEQITKQEEYRDGLLVEYVEYKYDEAGHVGSALTYSLQADGTFARGFLLAYLYFNDGNLYKAFTYMDNPEPDQEPILVSTKTYDDYLDAENPFPMVEILPNVKSQTKLPQTYHVEEDGLDIMHHITYEFRKDGRPSGRTVTSNFGTQTATYSYY